jgi:hypothetical protein
MAASDASDTPRGAAEPARWIGGRGFDLSFFFLGGTALAAGAGVLLLCVPRLVGPLWWAWLLLIDGPHLLVTWVRTYLDPGERARRRKLLRWSLLLVVPGLCAWLATTASGWRRPFDVFLLLATLWAFQHAVRQHYGILAIYERLDGAGAAVGRSDGRFLQAALWALYALFLVGHPSNRQLLGLPEPLPPWASRLVSALGLACAAALAGYALVIVRRALGRRPLRAALFALGPVLALNAFGLFVVGAFEPLYPHPLDPEQLFLGSAVVAGLPHGVQYLGLVWAVSRRRYASETESYLAPKASECRGSVQSCLAARLSRGPALAYLALVALSIAYLALNAARGTGAGFVFFAPGTAAARLFLALYWGLFFHHYYLDQKIWRPGRDPVLRRELGLESAT